MIWLVAASFAIGWVAGWWVAVVLNRSIRPSEPPCQLKKSDSQVAEDLLREVGYRRTEW